MSDQQPPKRPKRPALDIDADPHNANWIRELEHRREEREQQRKEPTVAVSDKPWDGSESRFSIEEWKRSCLIDTGEGDPSSKSRYKLPVKEPDGAVNANAVHAAAAALAGGRGGVKASPEAKKRAAKRIKALYAQLKQEPPESITRMAQ